VLHDFRDCPAFSLVSGNVSQPELPSCEAGCWISNRDFIKVGEEWLQNSNHVCKIHYVRAVKKSERERFWGLQAKPPELTENPL
jgi:hypothetical protein